MKNIEKFIEPWIYKSGWNAKDFAKVETPVYIVSESHLEKNLKILKDVQDRTGAKVLIAIKGFSMFAVFPLIKKYLAGAEASSVNEARLCREEFGKEVHVFSPSYTKENIKEYIKYSDHLVFNSFLQWKMFRNVINLHNQSFFAKATKGRKRNVSCGIRVNLEHSVASEPMYDPSRPGSHFGVTRLNFEVDNLEGLEGLHFHNLCELGADAFVSSLKIFEEKFGEFLPKIKWVNFGGGHHITRNGYDLNLLVNTINAFKKRHPHLTIYLEPGEAVALNAGVLVGSIIDLVKNNKQIAVLDVSATCHMPDVLEIPYLPNVLTASDNGKYKYTFVGPTCLTGDVIGEYSFDAPLKTGDKVIFMNMAIYTMVKNNTFNGVDLPKIAIMKKDGKVKVIKEFGYKDFKNRLS